MCAYLGVKNVNFSENFKYVLNELCLTDFSYMVKHYMFKKTPLQSNLCQSKFDNLIRPIFIANFHIIEKPVKMV